MRISPLDIYSNSNITHRSIINNISFLHRINASSVISIIINSQAIPTFNNIILNSSSNTGLFRLIICSNNNNVSFRAHRTFIRI